ncbi:MAG: major capsid protein [Pseudaminobacter sp.]
MATTRLTDIIVPEVFFPYMVKRTKEKSQIFQSGILVNDANMSKFLAGGGRTANVPFWKDLDNTEALVVDDDPSHLITPQNISASKDVAARQFRAQSWSSMRLSAVLAGDDPMKRIAELVSDYWVRQFQRIMVASLHGVYLDNVANDSSDMVFSIGTDANSTITPAERISAEAILDTAQTMGDASDGVDTLIMHSIVYNNLAKQNLIDFIPDSEGKVRFPSYLGYRVIKDDGVKTLAGTYRTKYVTYLLGRGSVCWNEAPTSPSPNIETEAKPDQGYGAGGDILYSRRQFVLHPYGIKWTDASVAGEFPTNAELATATNWDRVYPERKQINIAYLITNG